jgi:hypothetical protein
MALAVVASCHCRSHRPLHILGFVRNHPRTRAGIEGPARTPFPLHIMPTGFALARSTHLLNPRRFASLQLRSSALFFNAQTFCGSALVPERRFRQINSVHKYHGISIGGVPGSSVCLASIRLLTTRVGEGHILICNRRDRTQQAPGVMHLFGQRGRDGLSHLREDVLLNSGARGTNGR